MRRARLFLMRLKHDYTHFKFVRDYIHHGFLVSLIPVILYPITGVPILTIILSVVFLSMFIWNYFSIIEKQADEIVRYAIEERKKSRLIKKYESLYNKFTEVK